MKAYSGYQSLPAAPGCVVAVGNFDGVHRGHQEIIRRVQARAQELGASSLVYTFVPHPVQVLVPHLAPPLIGTYAQKREYLAELGVDIVVEEPFTREYAAYSPERFVTEVLHQGLGARAIFVGFDFTFGRGGKATADTLRQLCEAYAIEVHQVEPLSFDGIVASSTKVREFVLAGQMDGAALLLGRPFVLTGPIVHGEKRGQKIGFPTANLDPQQQLMPAHGVYACQAELQGATHPAVVNIGVRPTFHGQAPPPTVEAHLLDFEGDLYGAPMALHFQRRIRAEQAFASVDELRAQIERDLLVAREILLGEKDPPTPPSP